MLHEWAQAALQAAADGGPLIFLALACATLLSEDLTCIAAGLLVAQGSLAFGPATAACFVGILSGDLLLVLIGRTLGRQSLQVVPLRWWAPPALVERAEEWFRRRGPALIFASRFMPGTRVPVYFAAGALRAPMLRFAGWFALACAIWTPLLVGAAAAFGEAALRVFASWASVAPALLLAGAAAWLSAKAALNLSTWRGRRLALGRWRRLTRWQCWPAWLLHAPVWFQVLALGLRHRGCTLFTAANTARARHAPAPARADGDVVVGLGFSRDRDDAPARLLGLVAWQPIVVTGDGRRSLESLLLSDDRGVTVGHFLLRELGARADDIPAAGERTVIVPTTPRARGILFRDASAWLTPQFEAALQAAAREQAHLRLGWLELRAGSLEALPRGEFSVAAADDLLRHPEHVYDPERSLRDAWGRLLRVWRLGFQLGAQNRAAGRRPFSAGETWRWLRGREADPSRAS